MAVTQFRLFKICTCIATLLNFFKRLICRSGRGRKLSGDQITLPTTVDYSTSVPKSPEVEEWSSWDEEAPTSIKIEGGNGNVSPSLDGIEQEPDYFKDMTPTIRKTQKTVVPQNMKFEVDGHGKPKKEIARRKGERNYGRKKEGGKLGKKIVLKKREPLNYLVPDGSSGFSSRLAASQDMMTFNSPSTELGEMDNWQGDSNAWEDESDAAWEAEEVLRQQKLAEREKRSLEQQRKKIEKDAQRMMKKEQKMAVKLS